MGVFRFCAGSVGPVGPNLPELLFLDDFLDPPDLELKAAAVGARDRGLQLSTCRHWEHTQGSAGEPTALPVTLNQNQNLRVPFCSRAQGPLEH